MPFERNLRVNPDATLDTIMRGVEHQRYVNDLITRYTNADLLSRDDSIRLGGARAYAGLGERGRVDDFINDDTIRRVNLLVQLVNNQVTSHMNFAEVHPKLMDDGGFPREFERPRRVEELLSMDNSTLDRILASYNLPRDIRSRLGSPIRHLGSMLVDGSRSSRLSVLFEFLGVAIMDESRSGVLGFGSGHERSRHCTGGLGGGYRRELGM